METLVYTGCTTVEALRLLPASVDYPGRAIRFNHLKGKEPMKMSRTVPVPMGYLDTMMAVHGIARRSLPGPFKDKPLWPWRSGYVNGLVKQLMFRSGIPAGSHLNTKAIRHAYVINAINHGVPISKICEWMGHKDIRYTSHYYRAISIDQNELVRRMWQ